MRSRRSGAEGGISNRQPNGSARAVRDVLKWGSEAAARGLKAIDETVESIAKILKDLGDKANEIAKALKVGAVRP